MKQSLPLLPSLSPALHPLSLQVLLVLAHSLAALGEEKHYIHNLLCADGGTGLRGLTAAQ